MDQVQERDTAEEAANRAAVEAEQVAELAEQVTPADAAAHAPEPEPEPWTLPDVHNFDSGWVTVYLNGGAMAIGYLRSFWFGTEMFRVDQPPTAFVPATWFLVHPSTVTTVKPMSEAEARQVLEEHHRNMADQQEAVSTAHRVVSRLHEAFHAH